MQDFEERHSVDSPLSPLLSDDKKGDNKNRTHTLHSPELVRVGTLNMSDLWSNKLKMQRAKKDKYSGVTNGLIGVFREHANFLSSSWI